jgi:hypothetical protein
LQVIRPAVQYKRAAVDRFFGDAGKADQTLFPHAFGLKTVLEGQPMRTFIVVLIAYLNREASRSYKP